MQSKIFRVSLLIILLVAITMSIISGTLARYTESLTVTDSARVAKFSYKATSNGTELTNGQTINLFNTANDSEVFGTSANVNNEKLIAPGTYGSFDITVENTSEVKVGVTYDITETNTSSIPIIYYIKDTKNNITYYSDFVTGTSANVGADIAERLGLQSTDKVTISGDLSDMATAIAGSLDATNGTDSTKETTTLGWFWAFGDDEQSITKDTQIGKNTTPATLDVSIKVTFTQID